ncbi:hypothetical protein R1sor_016342 [Riccia sorocarpa]|uniref:Uncharacterized protein n=1 Tax=Riccia sorocarpa TaxID=122646 RepID=A0ABD3HEP9_9MARC
MSSYHDYNRDTLPYRSYVYSRYEEATLAEEDPADEAIPVEEILLAGTPMGAIPVDAIPLSGTPVEAIPVEGVPVEAIQVEGALLGTTHEWP